MPENNSFAQKKYDQDRKSVLKMLIRKTTKSIFSINKIHLYTALNCLFDVFFI